MLLNVFHQVKGKAVTETNSICPRAVGKEGKTTSFPDFYKPINVSAENKLS